MVRRATTTAYLGRRLGLPAARALALALALLPALPWLLTLPSFGPLPSNDYYGVLAMIGRPDGSWESSPTAWLALRSNEHHVTVPALVYAANAALFHGDNRGLAAWSLSMLALLTSLLVLLAGRELAASPPRWMLVALLLGILTFNPVQSHNLFLGFSGVMWLTSNLLAVAAIIGLARYADTGRWPWLAGALAAGAIGLVTYSTNLSVWPALLVGALVLRVRWEALVAVTSTAAAAIVFYAATYERPGHHPELASGELGPFVARYLGSLFAEKKLAGLAYGWSLLAASAILWAFLAWRRPALFTRLAPWTMVQIYAFGNALGTAFGRSGMSEQTVLASRYASLAALAWMGLLVPLAVAARKEGRDSRSGESARLLAGMVAIAMIGATTWERGFPAFEDHLERSRRQNEAIIALHGGFPVAAPLRSVVLPGPWQLWRNVSFMRAVGHVPFHRPLPFGLGQPIDPALVRSGTRSPVDGRLEGARMVAPGVAEASGWVSTSQGRVEWIVLVDQDRMIRGGGSTGFGERPQPHGAPPHRGWRGHLDARRATGGVEAFALLEGGELLHVVGGRAPIAPLPATVE